MNSYAQLLYLHEIAGILNDPVAHKRVLTSYELMLDFYGMKLIDRRSGQIGRNEKNYQERYRHLNRSTHNYLRITRILKCLGELGYEHLKLGFLLHVVRELYVGAFHTGSIGRSARDYWFPILRSQTDAQTLQTFIKQLQGEEQLAQQNNSATTLPPMNDERIKYVLMAARKKRIENGEQTADKDDDNDNNNASTSASDSSSTIPAAAASASSSSSSSSSASSSSSSSSTSASSNAQSSATKPANEGDKKWYQ